MNITELNKQRGNSTQMPTDYLSEAEKALKYLETSEADFARYKALHQAEKERTKIVKAQLILESSETTQAAKAADAEGHDDYDQAIQDWQEALEQFYLIEAKRTRAELTIEMYRSVNSAMKRGNI